MQHYILVPLDGSTLSEAILPHAVAVAHATESALMLMQVLEPVYEPIFGALGIPEFVEEEQLALMRDEQLASLHHYLENIARQLRADGLEIQTKVIEAKRTSSSAFGGAQTQPDCSASTSTAQMHLAIIPRARITVPPASAG